MENKLESIEDIKTFIHDMSICLEEMENAMLEIENTKNIITKLTNKQ